MYYCETSEKFNLSSLLELEQESSPLSKLSEHKQEYLHELERIDVDVRACEEKILQAEIVYYSSPSSFVSPRAQVKKVERGGAVVTYIVSVGRFRVQMKMLNLPQAAQLGKAYIAAGSFGQIIQAGPQVVAKRVFFQHEYKILDLFDDEIEWKITVNFTELQALLIEYAYNRICAALEIGPQVRLQPNFDMVCYKNAAQFYLEKCYPTEYCSRTDSRTRILYCLKVMHAFGLVHKDIKPANIAYSRIRDDLVLLDFGVTTSVKEEIGSKTLSHRQGTLRFMSPQMSCVDPDSPSYIDLFWNDLYAALKTIEEVNRKKLSGRFESQVFSSRKSDEKSLDEVFILHLYSLVNKQVPAQSTCSYFEKNPAQREIIAKCGFPDLLQSFSFCPGQSTIIKRNPEYLIRSMGSSVRLLYCFEDKRYSDYRVEKVVKNLRDGYLLLREDTFLKEHKLKYMLNVYQAITHRIDSRKSHPSIQFLRNERTSLLRLADYLLNSNFASHSIDCLQRVMNQQILSTKRDQEILQWFMEIIDTENQHLPVSTQALFGDSLRPNDRLLLTKSMMFKYNRGQFESAYRIAYYLKERRVLQRLLEDAELVRQEILSLSEELLKEANVQSPQWLLLLEFVMAEFSISGQHFHIIENYSGLLSLKQLDQTVRMILLVKLGEACRSTGQFERALEYYLESFSISEKSDAVCDLLYITTASSIICIYIKLGSFDQSIKLGYALVQKAYLSMSEPHATLIFQQLLISCFLGAGKVKLAWQLAEHTMDILRDIDIDHPDTWIVLTGQASTVRVTEKKTHFQAYYRIATQKASQSLPIANLYSIKSQVMLLVNMSDLCQAFQQSKEAKNCIDKAILALIKYAKRVNGKTETSEKSNSSSDASYLEPSWLTDNGEFIIPVFFEFLLKYTALKAYYYALMLMRLTLYNRFDEASETVKWAECIPAMLEFTNKDSQLKSMTLSVAQKIVKHEPATALRILETHPDNSQEFSLVKATVLKAVGRHQECIKCLRGLLENTRHKPSLRTRASIEQTLSAVYREQGATIDADQCLERAVCSLVKFNEQYPENYSVVLDLGICQMNRGSDDEALRWFERIVRSDPSVNKKDWSTAAAQYATCLYRLRHVRQSLFYFLKSIEAQCNPSKIALFYITVSCYELKKRKLFRKYFKKLTASGLDNTFLGPLARLFTRKPRNDLYLRLLQQISNASTPQTLDQVPVKTPAELMSKLKNNKQLRKFRLLICMNHPM